MKKPNKLWLVAISVLCVIFVFCILTVSAFAIIVSKDNSAYDLALSTDDIYIPEDMDKNNMGLFWLDASGKRYRYDNDEAPYDPAKPIVLYIHGWGGGGNIGSPEVWAQKGYNVGGFRWGEMARLDPFIGQSMLWGNNTSFGWERDDGKIETEDVPSHPLAKYFVACLNDFITEHGFFGGEIRLLGHSLGGQATLALSDYLMSEIDKGHITPILLPTRVTLLDPYLNSCIQDETYISWRGVDMTEAGSTKPALIAAKALHERGVAVEVVQSSLTPDFGGYFEGEPYYKELKQYVTWIRLASDFYNPITDMSPTHEYSMDWYYAMLDYKGNTPDCTYPDTAYGFSPFLPTAYSYARKGTYYNMPTNALKDDLSDDHQYSDVKSAKIAGFAFWDVNQNGICDEGSWLRVGGIKVYLYESGNDNLLMQTETSGGGYYEFVMDGDSHGKTYYIKIELPKGYKATSLVTDAVEIVDAGSLGIINIGIEKSLIAILADK